MEYTGASFSLDFTIKASESMQTNVLAGLAAVGIPAAGVLGARRKRPQDFTKEEYESAGKMNPDDFKG